MIITPWTPEYEYSCQQCHKTFKTKVPLEIEVGFRPVCSSQCRFQKVFFHVQRMKLPIDYLRDMLKMIKKKWDFSNLLLKEGEIQLSRYFSNLGLSNIMIVNLLAHLNEPAQKSEPSLAQNTGSLVPICTNEPLSQVSQSGSTFRKVEPRIGQKQLPLSPVEIEVK